MPKRLAIGLLVLSAITGCASRRWYEGTIVHPAELPVRAFAPVVFVHAADNDSTDVANALASRIEAGGTEARVVDAAQAQTVTSGIEVSITVRFTNRAETRWSTRPENVCGPYGCYLRQVSYPFDVITLVGDAVVDIREASGGAPLAQRIAHAEETGSDSEARRSVVRRRLAEEVGAWFDPRSESVRTRIAWLDDPSFAHALALAEARRWDEAAAELRAIRSAPGFASRPAIDRAKTLAALAIAIRFSRAARDEPVAALEEALAVSEEANLLEPSPDRSALRDALRAQLDEARVLAVQAGTGSAAARTIAVPDAYR